jgi:hypothetical protein
VVIPSIMRPSSDSSNWMFKPADSYLSPVRPKAKINPTREFIFTDLSGRRVK